jgi:hypothetical protein
VSQASADLAEHRLVDRYLRRRAFVQAVTDGVRHAEAIARLEFHLRLLGS